LAYIDAKFMRLYVQLMENLHTEQLEERQSLRDEQARLLAKTIRQVNDDDLAILLLLL
jgi:SAM-dependent MidA family methyltransferase